MAEILRISLYFLITTLRDKGALREAPELSIIQESMKSFPRGLLEIEEIPLSPLVRLYPSISEAHRYIEHEYTKFNNLKQLMETDVEEFRSHYTSTQCNSGNTSRELDGILKAERDMTYITNGMRTWLKDPICILLKPKAWNHSIYELFRYILTVIRKGYSVRLQSHVICKAFWGISDGIPRHVIEEQYKSSVEKTVQEFKTLAALASTRIAACEVLPHVENQTYIELEKFLQGIFPRETTLNEDNSAHGDCSDYREQGTRYYPYEGIRSDGDWKCHGLMYNCLRLRDTFRICKPKHPHRRVTGLDYYSRSTGFFGSMSSKTIHYNYLGKCDESDEVWNMYQWAWSEPWSLYVREQCACICDDFEDPRTLRRFSRDYVLSDYRNNMVVTGIRFVNISNVIHLQIQEGKLEGLSFINSSSVQWRLNNTILHRRNDSDPRGSDDVVMLSYHKRRMNLDALNVAPNEVIIGAAFDWTQEMDGVELTVFSTIFTLTTGELNQEIRKHSAPTMKREEIVLKKPHMPQMCKDNIALGGNNRFIRFQTTDWVKDAAQTTIPYLDIQEVVTNPPIMLRGIGLYYKTAGDCGGYVGLEIYSHEYQNIISYNISVNDEE